MKISNLCEEQNPYAATTYEALLRKEEKEIREHISVIQYNNINYMLKLQIEHQLKLYGEKITDQLEQLERENEMLKKTIVCSYLYLTFILE